MTRQITKATTNKNCEFCKITKIKEGIIYENKNFYIKVGFAIISPGHVMIMPKHHYPCLASAPIKIIREYNELKRKLIKEIKRKFAEPIIIEYGVWGQSIPHAHIHFIPKKGEGYKLRNILKEVLTCTPGQKVSYTRIKDLKELKKVYQKYRSYVMIESRKKIYIFSTKNLESKRKSCLDYRVLFTKKGLTGIKNWRKMTKKDKRLDEKKRKKTKDTLSFKNFG